MHNTTLLPITQSAGYNYLIKNMNLTGASVNPSRVPENADGAYYSNIRNIYLREDDLSTAIHE